VALVTVLPAPNQLAQGTDVVICRPARAESILRLMQQFMLLSSTNEPVGDYLVGQLTNHTPTPRQAFRLYIRR
jgi:hypothetical protein